MMSPITAPDPDEYGEGGNPKKGHDWLAIVTTMLLIGGAVAASVVLSGGSEKANNCL